MATTTTMAPPGSVVLPLQIVAPSRDSMVITSTKGLLNGPGQNNCFLNSAVQVLWHLDIFRRSFRDLSGHACMADSCIFCALKELFSQLQFSHETALPPDALRRALAESFFDQQRFQLGFMDDAAECFENMLLRIHTHIAQSEAEDMCQAAHCIPHQKFAMTLVEQSVCGSCGATSEPLSFTQMVHYVSASALTTQVRHNLAANQMPDTFGLLLKKAGNMGDIRDCPSSCGSKIQICRTLMNRPEIVSVGIVWDSERPTLDHIMDVFATLGTNLRLGDVFNSAVDQRWADLTIHNLVGVVTYYGKHYSTFFFHTKLRVWIYFDDATVREVGPRWDQVVEKCRRGRYQPLLLLYAVPTGTPVNTDQAPKQITPFYVDNSKSPTKKVAQSLLRRSVTPSPEKPVGGSSNGNIRRAITPNPDLQKTTIIPGSPSSTASSSYQNDYQNLSIIQDSIYSRSPIDCVDSAKEPQYVTRKMHHVNIHRTLSNGSSTSASGGTDGISIPDHLNIPRRRDSGNWSGDRNSASSASSTTMDNPYLYLVGKVPHCNGSGSVPGSPTRSGGGKSDSSTGSGSSGVYDAGYDSYSLSSNDSTTMSTIQHLMKANQLAKIPEDYGGTGQLLQPQKTVTCDMLCDEADELLSKSRQLEDEHDLVLALALCNAATTKARAAMNAPYNNPQTLVLARMKHNTCIMRARSLHRRMTQTQSPINETPIEIRHTREGSSGGTGRHSRQNSRDKSLAHSRQNSKELLNQVVASEKPPLVATKSIEIYATLPKKNKSLLQSKLNSMNVNSETDLYITKSATVVSEPKERESRSIFSRSKSSKEQLKVKEKRSRSEDRNKISNRDFSIAPDFANVKDTIKREKSKEDKDDKKDKDKSGKKQHKIRRKLLMGGLIKRKNRSMPDLTEGANANDSAKSGAASANSSKSGSIDDSSIGMRGADVTGNSMSGYLSEGHLEFSGNAALVNGTLSNPNLERSKLMRKSFHGSAGKVLTAVKVPPPPPLRTTSQLSRSKQGSGTHAGESDSSSSCADGVIYSNAQQLGIDTTPSTVNGQYHQYQYACDPSVQYNNYMNTYGDYSTYYPYLQQHQQSPAQSPVAPSQHVLVVTQADVHQEQSPLKPSKDNHVDSGVDEVDSCVPPASLDLPPYPSPAVSVQHSRQPSEEFPPPPPPLDLNVLDDRLTHPLPTSASPAPNSLLAQLQLKRQQILSQEAKQSVISDKPAGSGNTWLRELQAKQAALKKKSEGMNIDSMVQKLSTEPIKSEAKITSVRDLASRFETSVHVSTLPDVSSSSPITVKPLESTPFPSSPYSSYGKADNTVQTGVLSLKKREDITPVPLDVLPTMTSSATTSSIAPEQIKEEMREVEMINAVMHKALSSGGSQDSNVADDAKRQRFGKKKSVSFCDQVILVATAEEQEDDSYIPNPILERVLRSAVHKNEANAIRQEIISLRDNGEQIDDDSASAAIVEADVVDGQVTYGTSCSEYVTKQQLVRTPVAATATEVLPSRPNDIVATSQSVDVVDAPYQGYARRNSIDSILSRSNSAASTDTRPPIQYQQPTQQFPAYQPQPQQSYATQQQIYGTSPQYRQQQPLPTATTYNPIPQQHQQQSRGLGYPTITHHAQLQRQMSNPAAASEYSTYSTSPVATVTPRPSPYVTTSMHQVRQSPIPHCQPVYQHPPVPTTHTPSYSHYNVAAAQYQQQPPQVVNNRPPVHPNSIAYPQNGYDMNSQAQINYSPYQRLPTATNTTADLHAIYQHQAQSPYQRVPPPNGYLPIPQQQHAVIDPEYQTYQRLPAMMPQYGDHVVTGSSPYQRIPAPAQTLTSPPQQHMMPNEYGVYQTPPYLKQQQVVAPMMNGVGVNASTSPYLQPSVPKSAMPLKKSVSFEPGTKGGSIDETHLLQVQPQPQLIVNPCLSISNGNGAVAPNGILMTNDANKGLKCNLCRKKAVAVPNMYCTDCEFYMSRFKPKS